MFIRWWWTLHLLESAGGRKIWRPLENSAVTPGMGTVSAKGAESKKENGLRCTVWEPTPRLGSFNVAVQPICTVVGGL